MTAVIPSYGRALPLEPLPLFAHREPRGSQFVSPVLITGGPSMTLAAQDLAPHVGPGRNFQGP